MPLKIRGHLPVLDGLRGIAVLMVLLGHLYQKSFIEGSYQAATDIIGRVAALGPYGVELFFVLSGFLITGILLDTRHESGFFRKFYMRRVLRIFPLYYGVLVIVLLILPHLIRFDDGGNQILAHQVRLWTYFTNWPGAGWVWDNSSLFLLGHFWSLSVEEHFYLLWPSLVAWFSKRVLCVICFVLIGVGIACRAITAFDGVNTPALFQWTTLQRVDGLAIGALIAAALRDGKLSDRLFSLKRFQMIIPAALTLAIAYLWFPKRWHFAALNVVSDTFTETILAAAFGLALVEALRSAPQSTFNRILTGKILMAFGKYSYGLYVIHGILRPLFTRIFDPSGFPTKYGLPFLYLGCYLALTIAISFGLAWLSYQLYEKRFLALKSYFEYRKDSTTPLRSSETVPVTVSNAS